MSVTFADIRTMLDTRPAMVWDYEADFHVLLNGLTSQGISLTETESKSMSCLARIQNKAWPVLHHPRMALYASAYADAHDVTRATVQEIAKGTHAVTSLCALVNADLRVYELDLENPVLETGWGEEVMAHAISYGLMAVEDNVDSLVISSISAGSEQTLDHLHAALNGGDDPLVALARYAGHDLGAMIGAALAARMARIPVFCGPCLHAFLDRILTVLLGPQDMILLPANLSPWPDMLCALRQLQDMITLSALSPGAAQARPVHSIASAA